MGTNELILIVHGGTERQELEKGFEKAAVANRLWICRDGMAAFAYLTGAGVHRNRSQFPMPAMIIIDLQLPQEDAFTLLKWAQSQKFVSRTALVGVGPWEHHEDIQNAFDLGMNAYFRLPTELHDLIHFVRTLQFMPAGEPDKRENYLALDLVATPHSSEAAQTPWHVCLYVPTLDLATNSTAQTLESVFSKAFHGLRKIQLIQHPDSPLAFSKDEIFAVPTLIRKSPSPIRKIVGTFDESERLILSLDLPSAAS